MKRIIVAIIGLLLTVGLCFASASIAYLHGYADGGKIMLSDLARDLPTFVEQVINATKSNSEKGLAQMIDELKTGSRDMLLATKSFAGVYNYITTNYVAQSGLKTPK